MMVLLIGDVAGKVGRRAIAETLPDLRAEHDIELVVANVENAAGGWGVTPDNAEEFLKMGVDVMTSGNHIWDKREIVPYISRKDCRLLRPYNLPPGSPGAGSVVVATRRGRGVAVMNFIGRVFMHPPADCPFRAADEAFARLPPEVKVVIVDMHGEATSEKQAMGWHLDGRASCVVGTHTHVQTADGKILPQGTAYMTDLGLTGPHSGVIGMDKDIVLHRFVTSMPQRLEQAEGDVRLQAALVSIDDVTGRALSIQRLDLPVA